jgi:hypothetical protein
MSDTKTIIVMMGIYFTYVLFRDWDELVRRVKRIWFGRDEMVRRHMAAIRMTPDGDDLPEIHNLQ